MEYISLQRLEEATRHHQLWSRCQRHVVSWPDYTGLAIQ